MWCLSLPMQTRNAVSLRNKLPQFTLSTQNMQTRPTIANEPLDIQLVSKAECETIVRQTLGANANFNILSHLVKRDGDEIRGFLGEHLRLKITIQEAEDDPRDLFYFIKTLPIRNPEQRKICEEYEIIKKEAEIYSNILEPMGGEEVVGGEAKAKWRAKCYLHRDDLFVLEELNFAGYQHVPNRFECDNRHVRVVMRALAVMHADCMKLEERLAVNIGVKFADLLVDASVTKSSAWFQTGLRAIQAIASTKTKYAQYPKISALIDEHLWNKMDDVFEILENPPKEFLRVFLHRDIWQNNILFRFAQTADGSPDFSNPSSCVVVDFQMCRYHPPAADFLMATHLLVRRAEREQHAEANLLFYYKTLEQELRTAGIDLSTRMSLDSFRRSCEWFKLFALLVRSVFYHMSKLSKETVSSLHQRHEDYYRFCMVDRNEFVLRHIDEDPYYREWMIEAVEDIIEHTLLQT